MSTPFCTACGAPLRGGAAFCAACGNAASHKGDTLPFASAPSAGAPDRAPRSATGLIIGLAIACAVLLVAVVGLLAIGGGDGDSAADRAGAGAAAGPGSAPGGDAKDVANVEGSAEATTTVAPTTTEKTTTTIDPDVAWRQHRRPLLLGNACRLPGRCPPPTGPHFEAAEAPSKEASAAKSTFVRLSNPVATELGMRTWTSEEV